MSDHQKTRPDLLYRVCPFNGGLVFAKPERAQLIAGIYRALEESKTWGEFRHAMPPEEYRKIVESDCFDESEYVPGDNDVFSSDDVPGYSDGDYPPWLQTELDLILPKDVLWAFGKRETSVLNGGYWMLPGDREAEICQALVDRGYSLQRDQDLPFH